MARASLSVRRPSRGLRRMAGQAMAEFTVVSVLFLVPFFLVIPVLGKYLDLKASTLQAARYVAWERTVWYGGSGGDDESSIDWPANTKESSAIANEVRNRIFSEGKGLNTENDQADPSGSTKPMWRRRDGSALVSYDDVSQGLQNEDTPSLAFPPLTVGMKVTDALGLFAVEAKGLYGATVSVNTNPQVIGWSLNGDASKSFNSGALTFSESHYVLADGWSVKGRDHAKSQVEGLVPTGLMGNPGVRGAFTLLQAIAAITMPEALFMGIGDINPIPRLIDPVEPDIVPPDRLVGGD